MNSYPYNPYYYSPYSYYSQHWWPASQPADQSQYTDHEPKRKISFSESPVPTKRPNLAVELPEVIVPEVPEMEVQQNVNLPIRDIADESDFLESMPMFEKCAGEFVLNGIIR
jgi:hypothetical protein